MDRPEPYVESEERIRRRVFGSCPKYFSSIALLQPLDQDAFDPVLLQHLLAFQLERIVGDYHIYV